MPFYWRLVKVVKPGTVQFFPQMKPLSFFSLLPQPFLFAPYFQKMFLVGIIVWFPVSVSCTVRLINAG